MRDGQYVLGSEKPLLSQMVTEYQCELWPTGDISAMQACPISLWVCLVFANSSFFFWPQNTNIQLTHILHWLLICFFQKYIDDRSFLTQTQCYETLTHTSTNDALAWQFKTASLQILYIQCQFFKSESAVTAYTFVLGEILFNDKNSKKKKIKKKQLMLKWNSTERQC